MRRDGDTAFVDASLDVDGGPAIATASAVLRVVAAADRRAKTAAMATG